MKKRLAYSLLLSSFIFSGCQSTGTKDASSDEVSVTFADAEQLLANASLLQGAAQQKQILAAAELFLSLEDANRALDITRTLNPSQLGDALYAKQVEIQSQAYLQLDNLYAAKGLLENERLAALLVAPTAIDAEPALAITHRQASQLHELRAQIYNSLGEPDQVINERIALSRHLQAQETTGESSASDAQINQELIWMTLMDLDIQQLNALSQASTHHQALGWYELAIVSKNNQRNINQQYSALTQWQQQWPEHPANNPLPADLALIAEVVNNQPQNIALLLPLSNKLAPIAEAIRDGFMAAYFTNKNAGGQTPQINIYDVSQGNINEHYDFAVSQGAEVVIGPLSKEKISELALRPELAVPTLVLNQIEPSNAYPKQLFQLGLGIEDEAAQTALRAFTDGKRTALILAPTNNLGDRASQVFNERWQALGGTVVDSVRYSDERKLSQVIEHAMHLDISKTRARELRQLVGRFEFEPRRRQDIDMVFLVAQPRQGRQIKPLLAFHYAGDIPIYSTSSIYEGGNNKKEPDLNGITFSNLPWFFQETPERSAILQGKSLNARSQRLYALGVDAYYLYPRLEQLSASKRANFWGQTGILSLTEQRLFERTQQWAQFSHGRVKALTAHYDN